MFKGKYSILKQFIFSLLAVFTVSAAGLLLHGIMGYKMVGFIQLLLISILALSFEILPVLASAFISALLWNYLFIPPRFNFYIEKSEDIIFFLMYFVIAGIHTALTFKIRKAEKQAAEKEEKEKTIKLYNTLINSISHELKTPISSLMIGIDSLKNASPSMSENDKKLLINELEIASIRLNRQVENLLNVSRLESGFLKIKTDWCDLNELIRNLINKYFSSVKTHIISFIPNERMPLLKLDHGLIEIAIHNILLNSVQHTPDGSTITIKIDFIAGFCKIYIADNGKGFQYNEIDFIFDKFYRGSHSFSGGTGLGLSIAKGYTEAHNGTIKVNNIDTGGAKFTISIPTSSTYINQLKNE